jgi:hypothetical protein
MYEHLKKYVRMIQTHKTKEELKHGYSKKGNEGNEGSGEEGSR